MMLEPQAGLKLIGEDLSLALVCLSLDGFCSLAQEVQQTSAVARLAPIVRLMEVSWPLYSLV